MDVTPAQQPSRGLGQHLVLYDGVCGLCNGLVQFLLRRDRRGTFGFAPLQSATGQQLVTRYGGKPADLTSFYVVADYRTGSACALTRSEAALFVVGRLGWPWRLLRVARLLPKSIRDRAYDIVARHRYRLFGRYDRCLLPRQEFRDRFID
jgi:predicted DCC family thiol-disulfide oxidoreductase YuxK